MTKDLGLQFVKLINGINTMISYSGSTQNSDNMKEVGHELKLAVELLISSYQAQVKEDKLATDNMKNIISRVKKDV